MEKIVLETVTFSDFKHYYTKNCDKIDCVPCKFDWKYFSCKWNLYFFLFDLIVCKAAAGERAFNTKIKNKKFGCVKHKNRVFHSYP
jgi:hypothetical protein